MNQRRHRRRPSRRRGFTLIEVMISMSILAVGLLGVLQMQVLAAAQNGVARRTTQAAALLRDFQETARNTPWGDARFAKLTGGCIPLEDIPEFSEESLGHEATLPTPLQYTALQAGDPNAAGVGEDPSALDAIDGARPYRGVAAQAFLPVDQEGLGLGSRGYQLAWRVIPVDTNGDTDCEARLIQFTVRFQVGQSDRWRSYVGQVMQYNPAVILPGGMFESSRMEAW